MAKKKQQSNLRSDVLKLYERAPSLSIKFNPLVKKLAFNKHQKSELRYLLNDLISENILFKDGKYYRLAERDKKFEGKVILDADQDFAVETETDEGNEIIKIRKKNLSTALVNDIVEVSIIEFAERGRKEAVVENIIKRGKHEIIGRLETTGNKDGYAFVIPDDRKFRKDIYIPGKNLGKAKNGDKVICEIVNWEYQDLSPQGKVTSVLGKSGEVETEFKALIKKYGLKKTFPKKVNDEASAIAKNFSDEFSAADVKGRVDLRNKVIFTIDPATAKDFDDAVSIEINEKGNFLLGVHIADVSHYVEEYSALDIEAYDRGTSVYLMNDVVPMLPEKLSNEICSLKEDVDRMTFSVMMEIDKNANIISFQPFKSVIRSKKRFSYDEVQKIIDEQNGKFLNEINIMNGLHKNLFKKRMEEGSLDFETQEVDVEIDSKGNIKTLKPKKRLDSMLLIEDFMLLANKCATLYVERLHPSPPFLYRIHDIPDKKKIKELSYFVKQFGINLDPESKESIQQMLLHVQGKPEEFLINDITIRSMSKAVYSEENIGHYGLGFQHYTHFTSPIRRYPDLVVHRIIDEVLKGITNKRIAHYKETLPDTAKHSSDMEYNAVRAEREAIKILQIQYLEKHLGDIFDGIISGISEYGVYVKLTENLIEGMVRIKDLNDDYYILDERNFQLIGRHKGRRYRIGDKVKVKVHKLDKEKKWLDFVIV